MALADELGFAFRRPELVRQALTHRSYGTPHNERLEFIGDAVLNCVIAEALFERFPASSEGELSRVRASLVNRDTLARLAREISLPSEILLGDGESRSGGADRPSILADALEAVLGAVFLDGGYVAARAAILRVYAAVWSDLDPAALAKDAKTRLQEWLQARRMPVPEYAVTELAGEAHAQTFTVECRIPALGIAAIGSGASRRLAEQAAAERAYAATIAQDGGGNRG
ncbi:MAG TPA: ribonuclease III [Casimicrobiaceae bacterium]|nr:ribonuclease III [Casimicrobiaceae bacterium]